MQKIGKLIYERGLTPYRVAKLSGIPQRTVYCYASGERDIRKANFETVKKLADVLKVSVDEIVEE